RIPGMDSRRPSAAFAVCYIEGRQEGGRRSQKRLGRDPFGESVETMKSIFDGRIPESEIARILGLMSQLPNKREKPQAGDLTGNFDLWFDGGAVRYVTGYSEFSFAEGMEATVLVTPLLAITIRFPDGREVDITQKHR